MIERREFVIEIEYDKYHINYLRELIRSTIKSNSKSTKLKKGDKT